MIYCVQSGIEAAVSTEIIKMSWIDVVGGCMGFRNSRLNRTAFTAIAIGLLILAACTESTEPTIFNTRTPGSSPTAVGPTPTLDPRFRPDAYSPQRFRDA